MTAHGDYSKQISTITNSNLDLLSLQKTSLNENLSIFLPSISHIPYYIEIIIDLDNEYYIHQSRTFEEQSDEPSILACGGIGFKQYFIDCAHKERHLLCDHSGWTKYRPSVPKLAFRATKAWKAGVRAKPGQKERLYKGRHSGVKKIDTSFNI